MSLCNIFHGHDVLRGNLNPIHPFWDQLLASDSRDALSRIADCFELDASSSIRQVLLNSTDLGVVVPSRKRDRRILRLWRFAVLYAPGRALVFSCPTPECVSCNIVLPEVFARIVSQLGPFRLDQHSGTILCPSVMEKCGHEIDDVLYKARKRALPFFSYMTGDYECWLGSDFETTWYFDHEKRDFKQSSEAVFGQWFEQAFHQMLNETF